MGFRIQHASAVLPFVLLLLAFTFIALTATSMMTSETMSSKEDLQQYVDDVLNELTSYIKIQQLYGYYENEAPYHLSKIVIQATPLFQKEINLSTWIIQIQTKSDLKIYSFYENVSSIGCSSVFSHEHWNNLPQNKYGIISIQDTDDSLQKFYSFSEPSDIAFLTLSMNNLSIIKGDEVTIVISPGIGIEKTITFKAPLPIKQVVKLW